MPDPTDDPDAFAALLPRHGALIGLDHGERTVGVALSDPGRRIASPLTGVRKGKFSRTGAEIAGLCERHAVAGLVVGLPLNMDGSAGPSAQSARAFARNLAALTGRPVLMWDERLSTAAVTRTLIEADASRKRRAEVIDKLAAAFILQGALDRLSHRSP
jgi:putative Holliday junction resolvase